MVAWWQVVVTLVCIVLSGTFSGLTLGLMSLDIMDLRVLTESGTEKERWYADRILPVRKHGNWLLCTLLIGNTAVNSALAIVTADLFGGIAGFLASTIAILYIGEIIPQAVCHRFGLVIGAYAIPFVRLFMFLTAPLSFPTAKALDFLLGGESVTRYNKSQLKSLVSIHGTRPDDDPPGYQPQPYSSSARHPHRHSSDPDSSLDLNPPRTMPSTVSVVRGPDNATIVELPQIPSKAPAPHGNGSIDAYAPPARLPSNSLPPASRKGHASDPDSAGLSPSDRPARSLPVSTIPARGASNVPATATNATVAVTAVETADANGGSGALPDAAETETPLAAGKSRIKSLSKFYNLKRSRMAEKMTRKGKDREKKEGESVSSNPPLTRDEMAMLGGAFDFSQKTVAQVMTALDNAFMLEASLSLNFEVLLLIFQSGHSRVPVYDKTRENIIGVLFAKDLILLDPEDSVPIKTVLLFFNRTVLLVFNDTPLNKMLNIFKQGRGHMAIVQKITDRTNDDPVPDTLGVVTLEDLIEELIGQDIVDETDVYTDNISKQRVKRVRSIDPEVLKMFDSKHDEELLSEKEVLVVASYLSNNSEEFSPDVIKLDVLKEMLAQIPIAEYNDEDKNHPHGSSRATAGLFGINPASRGDTSSDSGTEELLDVSDRNEASSQVGAVPSSMPCSTRHTDSTQARLREEAQDESPPADITIYKRGVPTKNASLIINGRLEICAGSDGFISEAGPWTLLGVNALLDDLYAPDFTARVIERPARLLRIPRKLYRLMVRYNSTNPMAAVGDSTRPKISSAAALAFEKPRSTSQRRVSESSGANLSSSSIALAAAAAAVAVGTPSAAGKHQTLPSSAPDVSVVHKTRASPNGQSIEWSELGPLAPSGDTRVSSASASGDLRVDRTSPHQQRVGVPTERADASGKPPVKPPIKTLDS